jgi:hypothetical protein
MAVKRKAPIENAPLPRRSSRIRNLELSKAEAEKSKPEDEPEPPKKIRKISKSKAKAATVTKNTASATRRAPTKKGRKENVVQQEDAGISDGQESPPVSTNTVPDAEPGHDDIKANVISDPTAALSEGQEKSKSKGVKKSKGKSGINPPAASAASVGPSQQRVPSTSLMILYRSASEIVKDAIGLPNSPLKKPSSVSKWPESPMKPPASSVKRPQSTGKSAVNQPGTSTGPTIKIPGLEFKVPHSPDRIPVYQDKPIDSSKPPSPDKGPSSLHDRPASPAKSSTQPSASPSKSPVDFQKSTIQSIEIPTASQRPGNPLKAPSIIVKAIPSPPRAPASPQRSAVSLTKAYATSQRPASPLKLKTSIGSGPKSSETISPIKLPSPTNPGLVRGSTSVATVYQYSSQSQVSLERDTAATAVSSSVQPQQPLKKYLFSNAKEFQGSGFASTTTRGDDDYQPRYEDDIPASQASQLSAGYSEPPSAGQPPLDIKPRKKVSKASAVSINRPPTPRPPRDAVGLEGTESQRYTQNIYYMSQISEAIQKSEREKVEREQRGRDHAVQNGGVTTQEEQRETASEIPGDRPYFGVNDGGCRFDQGDHAGQTQPIDEDYVDLLRTQWEEAQADELDELDRLDGAEDEDEGGEEDGNEEGDDTAYMYGYEYDNVPWSNQEQGGLDEYTHEYEEPEERPHDYDSLFGSGNEDRLGEDESEATSRAW